METLNPISQKSPISSLRFRRRNDFDKFLKVIKVETKNLKGEKEPAGRGVKKIISNVAKGGIGLGAIIGLFSRKRSEDDFSKKLDISASRLDFTNEPIPPLGSIIKKGELDVDKRKSRIRNREYRRNVKEIITQKRFGLFNFKRRGVTKDFATRVKEAKTDPDKARSLKKINPTRSKVTFSQNVDANLIRSEKEIIKKFFTNQDSLVKKNAKLGDDFLKKLNETLGKDNPLFQGGTVDDTLKNLGRTVDDISPVTGTTKFFGAGRFFDPKISTNQSNFGFDLLQKTLQGATPEQIDDLIVSQREILKNVQRSREIFGPEFERFTEGKVFKDPMKRIGMKSPSVISVNPLKNRGRGGLATFFIKNVFGSNKKLTRQNRLTGLRRILPRGIGTKLGMLTSNPLVRFGLFLYDLIAAIREGRNIVNLKDNLVTHLIDLGIQINNMINADDPSKMRLFISKPDNPEHRLIQMRRNEKIMELKNSQNDQANNTVLIPMNTGNGQEGTPTNIPNPNSSSSNIAFNTDRLNIGDMVFLSKLSVG